MKKRLTKGFTIVEVLIATAILALFISMAVVGTSALFGTGEQMIASAKAAVLGSDVMKAITNELRFGEEFVQNGDSISYNSTAYGNGCSLKIDDKGQLTIVQNTTNDSANDKSYYPIGSAAYDEVRIKDIAFKITEVYNDSKVLIRSIISCTVMITSDGTNNLWQNTVEIVPLYQKATS